MNATQNRRNEMSSSMESLGEAYETSREMLAEHPLTATLVAFGAGAAIGVLVGHMLAGPPKREPMISTSAMEKLGHQVCEALRSSLPESVTRHLPQALAR